MAVLPTAEPKEQFTSELLLEVAAVRSRGMPLFIVFVWLLDVCLHLTIQVLLPARPKFEVSKGASELWISEFSWVWWVHNFVWGKFHCRQISHIGNHLLLGVGLLLVHLKGRLPSTFCHLTPLLPLVNEWSEEFHIIYLACFIHELFSSCRARLSDALCLVPVHWRALQLVVGFESMPCDSILINQLCVLSPALFHGV